jgi:hypothetical protein
MLLPQYDSGDHLHPNDAGYQGMTKAVNLALFRVHNERRGGRLRFQPPPAGAR